MIIEYMSILLCNLIMFQGTKDKTAGEQHGKYIPPHIFHPQEMIVSHEPIAIPAHYWVDGPATWLAAQKFHAFPPSKHHM